MNPIVKTFQYGGQTVKLETGRIARQASGAVMVTVENTSVLVTVVAAKSQKPGQDFFPLSVHYKRKPTPLARFQAVSSSAKVAQVRKKP